MYSPPNTEFKFILKELSTYGRDVERIHATSDKWVLYITPPYNGHDTIELDCIDNSSKELDNAIKHIRSIPEFTTIREKNLQEKSKTLNKFYQAHTASSKSIFGSLRRFYRDKPIKTPDDFYQFYENLLCLALSNFVSPEQLKKVINMYTEKKPHEKLILPAVDNYDLVNLDNIKIVEQPVQTLKKPTPELPVGLARERLVRKELLREVAIEDVKQEESIKKGNEMAKKMIDGERSILDIIEHLEEELEKDGECNLDSLE
jgi:hypothetical protein